MAAATARLLYGCMGLDGDRATAEAAVEAALDAGITRFDHADIYRGGAAERVFGEVLRAAPDLRERIQIQSKVGIRLADAGSGTVQHYDLSAGAIAEGVYGSLERLGVDRLDTLLLHRPDPLADPAEIAAAVADLHAEGVIGRIGVSNFSAVQIAALAAALPIPVVADQLELSLARHDFVDAGILVNHRDGVGTAFPHGTLEHCTAHGIEIQAWGALAAGRYSGAPSDDPHAAATAALVADLAERHGVAPEAVVLGWLMRHPARISPVIGTTDPARIRRCADAETVAAAMTRPQWYALLTVARGRRVP